MILDAHKKSGRGSSHSALVNSACFNVYNTIYRERERTNIEEQDKTILKSVTLVEIIKNKQFSIEYDSA